jgi:3-dehydroquinate synthase
VSQIKVRFSESADRSHDIVFGEVKDLPQLLLDVGLSVGRCVIVTDTNVAQLYGDLIEESLTQAGWRCLIVTLPPGEPTKSLDRLSEILDSALSFGIERESPVIAIGGGVVGDVAGFAAAVLLRGVPLVQVPTSLVAQVDSSIGGKTGINHATGKNLVGAFHQPSLVLIDTSRLSTLPMPEWMGGLSEVVKTALIWDADLFEFLRNNWGEILQRRPGTVAQMVTRCVEIKVAVVQADERESGQRAILNFGHTFGHALEKVVGYSGVTHGIAVAVGMRAALHLSELRYPEQDFSGAAEVLMRLPVANDWADIDVDMLLHAMLSDKKRVGERLRFVILDRVGSAVVVDDVTEQEIRSGWELALGPLK